MNLANFVKHPRTLQELQESAVAVRSRTFRVVKRIHLTEPDYDNFITDLLTDRQFIRENWGLCRTDLPLDCLLVQKPGQTGGVLLTPEARAFVKWAATVDFDPE